MNNKFLDQDRQIPIDTNIDIPAIITKKEAFEQTKGILAVDNMYLSRQDLKIFQAVSDGEISLRDAIKGIIAEEKQNGRNP